MSPSVPVAEATVEQIGIWMSGLWDGADPVSYTHLRAHETVLDLVCRLLLENKKTADKQTSNDVTHIQCNTIAQLSVF